MIKFLFVKTKLNDKDKDIDIFLLKLNEDGILDDKIPNNII